MSWHGFVRVAAAAPRLRVADCDANIARILEVLGRASAAGISVVVFPELSLTGYTCADLFQQQTLLRSAQESLLRLAQASASVFPGIFIVGLPVALDDRLFNCAAVIHAGQVLGLVPKTYLANYKEFYEARWFSSGAGTHTAHIQVGDAAVPFGTDLLFQARTIPRLILGVEICEDLWVPVPPSSHQALAGATLLVNLSASNEVIGKCAYRRQLVLNQSGRCMAGYVYASSGVHESTTDLVFGGHCLIAENASMLAESQRFERDDVLVHADIDLENLTGDRMRTTSFARGANHFEIPTYRTIPFDLNRAPLAGRLARRVEAHPFVPRGTDQLRERCEEIFLTQVTGLAGRLEHLSNPPLAIGVSGGLDSTLALVVACKTIDRLGGKRTQIQGFTMPGFGTTTRTLGNARSLMAELGVTAREIDIRALCLDEMRALGHHPFGIDPSGLDVEEFGRQLRRVPADKRSDLTFENIQARMRTSLLMNAGFVVGTGDLSELALGWTTYNADHMSMYNPNVSVPKTLVRFLVRWAAENEFTDKARAVLLDIVNTIISPELLPLDEDGAATQSTEGTVGPYELHDFFLYHFLRFGTSPERILLLAGQAEFDRPYSDQEVRHWLSVFLKRFFASQFKRSCLPDGPKVGSVSLSPRGDWRMPSDAQVTEWLRSLVGGGCAE